MECPKCNTLNTEDSQFCKTCATSLTGDAGAQVSFTKTLETPSKGIFPGTTFAARYKVIEELGRGGMGIVYKAEDAKLKRPVAIKLLPPELTGNQEAKARFIREAQSAAVLDHPNICTIYEVDESEDKTFISMAYVDGQNLRERVKEGPLEINEGLDLGIQAAEGLAAAHGKGIVHRDIKSANIMVTKQGQAKIMDFGLAKFAGASLITREGVTMDFSRPGKPMDNAMIESFNGSFRDECLNVNWFLSIEDAREKIEMWREDYNDFRPHSALGDLTPQQFSEQFESQKSNFLAGTVFG